MKQSYNDGPSTRLALTVEAVLERLEEWAHKNDRPLPKRSGNGWSACCPAHDDHRPSLSVSPGEKHPVVIHCHAGCVPAAVFDSLGLGRPRRRKQVRIERKPSGGALIHYDFTARDSEPSLRPGPQRREGAQPEPTYERGSFNDRVVVRRVDLIEAIENGLPPINYLPASDEMLVRGKRHLLAAPAKDGKSLAALVHTVDMVFEGAVVAIFDRENGAQTYARRLQDIILARNLTAEQRAMIQGRLAYHEFPSLRAEDREALVAYCQQCDLVVFDSQRMFLSELGLKEDVSDDYAQFMDALIDPLFRAGVATLVLDNTGHTDKKRSRGSSAKGDLNELVFSLQKTADFDLFTTGEVKLKVEKTRFGNTGEWTMKLGGGQYGSWQSNGPAKPRPDFQAAVVAVLMKHRHPLGMNRLITEVRRLSVSIGTVKARELLAQYVADAECNVIKTDTGYTLRAAPEPGGAAPRPKADGAVRRDNKGTA